MKDIVQLLHQVYELCTFCKLFLQSFSFMMTGRCLCFHFVSHCHRFAMSILEFVENEHLDHKITKSSSKSARHFLSSSIPKFPSNLMEEDISAGIFEIQLCVPSCTLVFRQLSQAGSTSGVVESLLLANCSDKHGKENAY